MAEWLIALNLKLSNYCKFREFESHSLFLKSIIAMTGFEPIFSEYEPDKLPIASHHKIYIYIYIYIKLN